MMTLKMRINYSETSLSFMSIILTLQFQKGKLHSIFNIFFTEMSSYQ